MWKKIKKFILYFFAACLCLAILMIKYCSYDAIKEHYSSIDSTTGISAPTTKVDLKHPEMGRVYTFEVAEDYDPRQQKGQRQMAWVLINGTRFPVAIENVANPYIMCGLKKGQFVRIVFVDNGPGNNPSALYVPDFFEH